MGFLKIKTFVNVAKMMKTKGYVKGDVQSHAFAVSQLQFHFRAWTYQRPFLLHLRHEREKIKIRQEFPPPSHSLYPPSLPP